MGWRATFAEDLQQHAKMDGIRATKIQVMLVPHTGVLGILSALAEGDRVRNENSIPTNITFRFMWGKMHFGEFL